MKNLNRLFLSLTLLLVVVACDSKSVIDAPIKNINAEAAKVIVEQEQELVVLDVRTPEEYAAGHIDGAVNIDIMDEEFPQKVAKLDHDKIYLVHCSGNVENGRAERSMKIMKNTGFGKLLNMTGGFIAWEENGNPVVHSDL